MPIYNEKVMDHFMNPRNVGEIENADGIGEEGNPEALVTWRELEGSGVLRYLVRAEDGSALVAAARHPDPGHTGVLPGAGRGLHRRPRRDLRDLANDGAAARARGAA